MKIVIGILLVAVIALILGFVPIKEVPYTITIQYLDTETYYEIVQDVQVYSRPTMDGSPTIEQDIFVFHKQVEKERVVIKERLETRYKTIPLLDYWLHY